MMWRSDGKILYAISPAKISYTKYDNNIMLHNHRITNSYQFIDNCMVIIRLGSLVIVKTSLSKPNILTTIYLYQKNLLQ